MTIPEDMMAFIEETARKAAREGAKEVVAEQARKAAGRCDRRLRNTKLLLKNYRMFKKHCTGAVYTDEAGEHDGQEEETALELLDMMLQRNNAITVESIRNSCRRTKIMIRHIDAMLGLYETYDPMAGDVAPDKSRRWLTWHPAFLGGKNSKGGMTSGAGLPPMPWTSANAAIPMARKITAYDALWTDRDQQYVLAQWRLRHWTLSNSGKLEGCTVYNYQYSPAVAETGVKRVLVTKAQGANFLVGSAVCMGERGENTGTDRNTDYNHNIFNWAKISSITNVTVSETEYVALNLELDSPIDTTTTMLVSTMPWESGTTEGVQGHSDGCRGNLTNGKYPYRVAGIEMQIGAYTEQLDPLWKASIVDDDHWHYDAFACRSGEKQVGSISSDYEQVGSFDLNDKATWSWHYIRKLGKLGTEAMMYEKFGGSGSTYVRAAFPSPGSVGVYAPWRGGGLFDGACCGLPCAVGYLSPASSSWYGVPRLAGSGKKRG